MIYGFCLSHHGIKGQKWGIENGPPYPINNSKPHTVFISGSSKTQFKDSGYYRQQLPKDIKSKIDSYMSKGDKIVIGDAPGIDRQVQNYLKSKKYDNVEIYSPGTKARYLANKKWKSNLIDASEFEPGSSEWLAKKDKVMSKIADEGLAVILDNGGAQATRNNVKRLIEQYKDVSVYELNSLGKNYDRWIEDILKEI